jgi:hypothetical protein
VQDIALSGYDEEKDGNPGVELNHERKEEN